MNITNLLDSPVMYQKKLHLTRAVPKSAVAFTVDGNCMEGKQIFDKDSVLVATDRMPRKDDPCLCIVHGKPMFKVFHGTISKGLYSVGTCYRWDGKGYRFNPDGTLTLNQGLFATEIGGVIIGAFDSEGEPRWLNDYKSYPEELPEPVQNPDSNVKIITNVRFV